MPTARRPLVRVGGVIKELPTGDLVPPSTVGTSGGDPDKVLKEDGTSDYGLATELTLLGW